MIIYKLKNKKTNWGDYSDMLLTGMTAHLDRYDGLLQLERTGPFVPSLINSGLGDIIVTEIVKDKLQVSGLIGFDFKPVIKRHIVDLDWMSWNLEANEPLFYPEKGEPENYILDASHSDLISDKLGNLWELVIPTLGTFDQFGMYIKGNESADIFKADNKGHVLLSERTKDWIEKNAGEWIVFEAITI